MGKIWNIGAVLPSFTPEGESEIVVEKTSRSQDAKLTYTTERFEIFSDQESAAEYDALSTQNLLVNIAVPLDFAQLAKLSTEFVAGSSGYALESKLGISSTFGVLKLLKKGATTGSEDEYVLGRARVRRVDLDMSFKVEGEVFVPIEFIATKDSDGKLMKTGNYTA